jgi:GNAT superfamily N-acetyltransferase
MVQEWDPATAPEAELGAVVDLLNAAGEVDVPDDPRWRVDGYREYLCCTMPGERRACWIAPDPHADRLLGQANVLLMDDIGVIDLIVHPDARNHGVGSALLLAVARRAADEGVPALGVEAIGDTPAGKKIQQTWLDLEVVQCGYCQSGQIMSAAALLAGNADPNDADIDEAMSGNICRCGTYPRIREAIKQAARSGTAEVGG